MGMFLWTANSWTVCFFSLLDRVFLAKGGIGDCGVDGGCFDILFLSFFLLSLEAFSYSLAFDSPSFDLLTTYIGDVVQTTNVVYVSM